MKNQYLFKYFAGMFFLASLLSACDKFEEDTSPLPAAKLVVKNDAYTTTANQGIQLQVLANDSISGQASVQFSLPKHGTLQAGNTPGSVFYLPHQNFVGKDTLGYQVCQGTNCISALATIDVKPDSANPCIVAIANDTASVIQGQSVTVDILRNDQACNLKPVISQPAQFGQAYFDANNQLIYTPAANYSGFDEVRYTLGGPATGLVKIRVLPSQPPCLVTANADMVNMPHNQAVDSIAVNVLANDTWCPTGPTPTINLVSQSSHGSVVVTGSGASARIVYTTNTPLRHITDTFQYRTCQGSTCSNSTVTVNIQ